MCWLALLLLVWLTLAPLAAAQTPPPPPTVSIPRVTRPPTLEEFLDMQADDGHGLLSVENFVQRFPDDGKPSTQRTVAYLGYDDKNLYVIFLCYDTESDQIRARLVKREEIWGDDVVFLLLDTFHDARRAYVLLANPLGIQADFLAAEGQPDDMSFDTLWYSDGKRTPQGFVVRFAVPFRSLRFADTSRQSWGLAVGRSIGRYDEQSWWPAISQRLGNAIAQAATATGLEHISPGRNLQFIPYGFFRSFRVLDPLGTPPAFLTDRAHPDAGLDAKLVFKDSLVLDVALNPDFSQVESDEPQVTVNQRFEVFFPEKRPFFLENSTFFNTPFNLVFTRRIRDPQYGARLTGKLGPYAIGAFVIDDQSVGKDFATTDPLFHKPALFGIVRINRDLFRQSTLGVLATTYDFEGTFNRVGGPDFRLRFTPTWALEGQAITSNTHDVGGTRAAGPAYNLALIRNGRSFFYEAAYNDVSPGFRTAPGFVQRTDMREISQFASYRFWREGGRVSSFATNLFLNRLWNHAGERQDWVVSPGFNLQFRRNSGFGTSYRVKRERFQGSDFQKRNFSFGFRSSYLSWLSVFGGFNVGTEINFSSPAALPPFLANRTNFDVGTTLRPLHQLRIESFYILSRLTDRSTGASIFNNHIARMKVNYQFTRRLSLRTILQYEATLANLGLIDLDQPRSKRITGDFLLTYFVHPGTVLYIGYSDLFVNLNLENGVLSPTRDSFLSTGRQFFAKFSYLFRF